MSRSGHTHFSSAEITNGLQWAKEKHRLTLDADTLQRLANAVGVRWNVHYDRKNGTLYEAKGDVFKTQFSDKTAEDSHRRDVYSSTVSHLFGERARVAKQRAKERKLAQNAQLQKAAFLNSVRRLGDDGNQYELILR